MELFHCEPYRLRLTTLSCGSQYRAAQHGDSASPSHRRECVGCEVGKAHAAGKDSGADVAPIKFTPRPRRSPVAKPAAKPDRTCEYCQKVFTPHRMTQRFCPGGSCNAAYHRAKRRVGPERPRRKPVSMADLHKAVGLPPKDSAGPGLPTTYPSSPEHSNGTVKIYPADRAHAHSVVMGAVEENPDLFSGLSPAALPALARHVAAAIVRERGAAE